MTALASVAGHLRGGGQLGRDDGGASGGARVERLNLPHKAPHGTRGGKVAKQQSTLTNIKRTQACAASLPRYNQRRARAAAYAFPTRCSPPSQPTCSAFVPS